MPTWAVVVVIGVTVGLALNATLLAYVAAMGIGSATPSPLSGQANLRPEERLARNERLSRLSDVAVVVGPVLGIGIMVLLELLVFPRLERRRYLRLAASRCTACGYDVASLGGVMRCPECGWARPDAYAEMLRSRCGA